MTDTDTTADSGAILVELGAFCHGLLGLGVEVRLKKLATGEISLLLDFGKPFKTRRCRDFWRVLEIDGSLMVRVHRPEILDIGRAAV